MTWENPRGGLRRDLAKILAGSTPNSMRLQDHEALYGQALSRLRLKSLSQSKRLMIFIDGARLACYLTNMLNTKKHRDGDPAR
jgi:hypothetical protein